MSETPLGDAVKQIPQNELSIEAEANEREKEARIAFQREKGNRSGGVTGGISTRKGWWAELYAKWRFK